MEESPFKAPNTAPSKWESDTDTEKGDSKKKEKEAPKEDEEEGGADMGFSLFD